MYYFLLVNLLIEIEDLLFGIDSDFQDHLLSYYEYDLCKI
jgi:hypothetical protein